MNIFEALSRISKITQCGGFGGNWTGKGLSPVAMWRYQNQTPELAAWIDQTIGSYRGSIEWQVESPVQTSVSDCSDKPIMSLWKVYPRRLGEYAKSHGLTIDEAVIEFAKVEPEFGRIAADDLNRLIDHIVVMSEKM